MQVITNPPSGGNADVVYRIKHGQQGEDQTDVTFLTGGSRLEVDAAAV